MPTSQSHQVKKAIARELNMEIFHVNYDNLKRMSNPDYGFPNQERIANALNKVGDKSFRYLSTWQEFRNAL